MQILKFIRFTVSLQIESLSGFLLILLCKAFKQILLDQANSSILFKDLYPPPCVKLYITFFYFK